LSLAGEDPIRESARRAPLTAALRHRLRSISQRWQNEAPADAKGASNAPTGAKGDGRWKIARSDPLTEGSEGQAGEAASPARHKTASVVAPEIAGAAPPYVHLAAARDAAGLDRCPKPRTFRMLFLALPKSCPHESLRASRGAARRILHPACALILRRAPTAPCRRRFRPLGSPRSPRGWREAPPTSP
jgi:hypothetical protein